MVIYIGADHRGFKLKESIRDFLKNKGYEVVDMGNANYDQSDDYVDFAKEVAKKVSMDSEKSRGILICGSGVGMDVAANKFKKVRSALALSSDQIYAARQDDNVNILSLAASFINEADAQKIVSVFVETPFSTEERYQRRIDKIAQIENELH
ncbi:MAG: RpiB/LacA/LacB family sugar-phosphate isomerase [Candidatus Liptonbacteria bacterium]|nr:RpiB/LacA/LacB family sugar-phosphate isomerase [Candidatus Liptonbacteria bacterium]